MTQPQSTLDRLGERIERLPDWCRPVFYVPMILTAMIAAKAALLGIPLGIVTLIAGLRGKVSLGDLLFVIQALGVAYLGSAVSGLLYGVIGRHLLSVPRLGRYFCGILCIMPYMAALTLIVMHRDHGTFMAKWSPAEYVVLLAMSLLFGTVVGHTWFDESV